MPTAHGHTGAGAAGWCWCERTNCRAGELFMTLPTYFRNNGFVTAGNGKLFHPDACSHYGNTSPQPALTRPAFTKVAHAAL